MSWVNRHPVLRRRWCRALLLAVLVLRPEAAAAQTAAPDADAFSAIAVKIAARFQGAMGLAKEVAEAVSETDMFSDLVAAKKIIDIKTPPDPNDTICRINTARGAAATVDGNAQAVGQALEEGSLNLMTGQRVSPTRLAVGWLYQLCKSGQLRRGTAAANFTDSDFGEKWFVANGCIEDQTQAHAFLRPTTILDHPVLVPPSQDQMDVLNNPASAYVAPVLPGGTPETVWVALTDKQKLFVGAKLFCDNLAMSRINPTGVTSDQAMMPGNMAVITQRFSANGLLSVAQLLCQKELARRTAPDPSDPGYAGNPAMQLLLTNGQKIGSFLTVAEGKNPEDLFAYTTVALTGVNVPGSAKLDPLGNPQYFISPYVVERYSSDYCDSAETTAGFIVKSGSAAEQAKLNLKCLEVMQNWEFIEIAHKASFVQTVLGMPDGGSVAEPEAAPAKASYDGGKDWRRGLLRADAAIDGMADDRPVLLSDMLQMIKSTTFPTKVATKVVGAGEGATP